MRKNMLAFVLSSIAILPTSVFADGPAPGFYIGGSYTGVRWDIGLFDAKEDFGVLAVRGGYQINDYVAIEGRLGAGAKDADYHGVDLEIENMYGIYGKVGLPTDSGFYPYAMLGMTHAKVKASIPGATVTDSDSDVSYGLGVDYWVNKTISLGVEYANFYDKEGDEITGITLGVNFKF
jgi:opacity protein-like surface antigen